MRVLFGKALSSALVALALTVLAPSAAEAGDVDDAILAEINFARENPQIYAWGLLLQPVSDWERALGPNGPAADAAAREEAIDFLMHQTPLPPLRADDRLVASALEHVAEQGPVGAIGHNGRSGERFDARIRRHDVMADVAAENIAYGPARPSDVVRELIIDSGVPSRGHRANFFLANVQSVGVSCGAHRAYGAMCVMDFAGRPLEAQGWRLASLVPEPSSTISSRNWVLSGAD